MPARVSSGPRVSVVIATYNGARFLPEAIDSALADPEPGREILVVDDGSTDGTAAVVARYADSIRYLLQSNRGPSAARNAGIRAARGDYVAFLDHDDRFRPGKLARQAAVLDARAGVGLVYTSFRFIDDDGRVLPQPGFAPAEEGLFEAILLGNPLFLSAVMVRRALLEAVGGFDEARRRVEDWDLWLRLWRVNRSWVRIDEPLLDYRVHRDQRHVGGQERRLADSLEILDRVFADPDLPADLRALAPRVYQNAHLRIAAIYYRAGAQAEGGGALHAALRARPGFLGEPQSLRQFCRLLLPTGTQGQAALVADWRRVTRLCRTALHDVLSRPDLEPELARMRWPARLNLLRLTGRLARKRLLGGGASLDVAERA